MNQNVEIETRTCPRCKAEIRPVPIVYGFPSAEMWEDEQAGKVRLGGCVVWDESPDYSCPACEAMLPWVAPERAADFADERAR